MIGHYEYGRHARVDANAFVRQEWSAIMLLSLVIACGAGCNGNGERNRCDGTTEGKVSITEVKSLAQFVTEHIRWRDEFIKKQPTGSYEDSGWYAGSDERYHYFAVTDSEKWKLFSIRKAAVGVVPEIAVESEKLTHPPVGMYRIDYGGMKSYPVPLSRDGAYHFVKRDVFASSERPRVSQYMLELEPSSGKQVD